MEKLKSHIQIKHGYAFSGENIQAEDNGTVLVTPGNFAIGGGFKNDKCKYFYGDYLNEYVLHPGDLIVTMTDLSKNADTLGYGAIIPTNDHVYLHNQRIGLVELLDDVYSKDYLYWFFRSPNYHKQIVSCSTGSTVHHTSPKKICDQSAPLCPKNKQIEISNVFYELEKIINHRKEELIHFDKLIRTRFFELFGSIHDHKFEQCKLRDVAHIKHGYAFNGEYFSDDNNGIVLVTPGNFALGGGFQEVHNRYYTSVYPEEYVLHAGDLIVTMTDLSKNVDTLGYGAIIPNTNNIYLHNQRIGLFDKLDERLNPVFVMWFMQTDEYRLEIVRTSTGSTVHHTSPDRILDSLIFLPPIKMQNEFASFVNQVEKSKVVIQRALYETQVLFDSLMQKYFGL